AWISRKAMPCIRPSRWWHCSRHWRTRNPRSSGACTCNSNGPPISMDPMNELEWLLEVAPECRRDDDGMASMERLIATSIDHLACVSGALVLKSGVNVCVRGHSAQSLGNGLPALGRLEKALIDGIGTGDAAQLERHLPPAPLEVDCKVITV